MVDIRSDQQPQHNPMAGTRICRDVGQERNASIPQLVCVLQLLVRIVIASGKSDRFLQGWTIFVGWSLWFLLGPDHIYDLVHSYDRSYVQGNSFANTDDTVRRRVLPP